MGRGVHAYYMYVCCSVRLELQPVSDNFAEGENGESSINHSCQSSLEEIDIPQKLPSPFSGRKSLYSTRDEEVSGPLCVGVVAETR